MQPRRWRAFWSSASAAVTCGRLHWQRARTGGLLLIAGTALLPDIESGSPAVLRRCFQLMTTQARRLTLWIMAAAILIALIVVLVVLAGTGGGGGGGGY
jgi:hypothetical protein